MDFLLHLANIAIGFAAVGFLIVMAWKTDFATWLFTERPVTNWLLRTGGALGDLLAHVGLRDRKNAAAFAQNLAVGVSMAGLLLGKSVSVPPEVIALVGMGICAYANMIHPYSAPGPEAPDEPEHVAHGAGFAHYNGRR